MTANNDTAPASPLISLACVEICNFRRLANVRMSLDAQTTILVGANNSGKTAVLAAIRKFLSDSPAFRSFDISISQWAQLRTLGELWEALAEAPTAESAKRDDWDGQLHTLLSCMPFVDLWFNAREGAFNHIAPFITTLKWTGGWVGVRLRLEPASSVEELQQLAREYREARQPVRSLSLDQPVHAWPTDLLDYWLRRPEDLGKVAAFKLDPAKGPNKPAQAESSEDRADSTEATQENSQSESQVSKPQATPQTLPTSAPRLDRIHLRKLIRVDFIPAQRGLGGEDEGNRPETDTQRVGLFSSQLLKFARQHLSVDTKNHSNQPDLVTAVAKAQNELDGQIDAALRPSIEEVKKLGYPGLHDPQEIRFRTRIQTADLLEHSTAVQYELDKASANDRLPEYSIGLGYQNLQSLSYQLVSFKASRLNPTKGSPAAVHLVMLEEPEAHLHVQVQRHFPAKAYALMSSDRAELCSQLLISTHSSHLAHAESLTRLRYARRLPRTASSGMQSTEVVDLGDAFGSDTETRTFAERYFYVQHTDLLFADAAIFVEGTAERMLVPMFIEHDFPELTKRYISFLEIGGSHAHRLRPLVEKLGIPTVVITDIDPVLLDTNANGRTVRKAQPIGSQNDLRCGNNTLTEWHPRIHAIDGLKAPTEKDLVWDEKTGLKVRFAWQVPIPAADNSWPSSFEDALILSNLDWFRALGQGDAGGRKIELKGALGQAVATLKDVAAPPGLAKALHDMLRDRFNKGDFAATLLEHMNAGAKIACAAYIADALSWLANELTPGTKESQ